MAKKMMHEDFGEKIGGARKDLGKSRTLFIEDLNAMNEREAEKYVKKDKVWKKPDYEAMLRSGIPTDVTYFVKKMRDSLNAGPVYSRTDTTPEDRLARQKEYIQTVQELQAVAMQIHNREDAMRAFERFFVSNGYMTLTSGISYGYYRATQKGKDNTVITNKLAQAILVRSRTDFENRFTEKAKKEQFGIPKEEKIPKGYSVHFNKGTNAYSKNGNWKPDTYYVTKGYVILQKNFSTEDAAVKWVQEYAKERTKPGKIRFMPPQLANVRRTGADYRHGRQITGQDYLDCFGFRGGEYGIWMNQDDRQVSLNMGYDALKDLAAALQIKERDISFDGTLSIAFGARGKGSAVAHYEPLRKVINLTKMHGAGSLAHEWWHGLDDYLGGIMGSDKYLSDKPSLYKPFQNLISTMKQKQETPEQTKQRVSQQKERMYKNASESLGNIMGNKFRQLEPAQAKDYAALRERFLSGDENAVEEISAFRKFIVGKVIPKGDRDRLKIYGRILAGFNEKPVPMLIETEFYKNSIKMGKECEKDGGYWDSNVEMTARAFACYIKDKVAPEVSDYLDGHADCAVTFTTGKDGKLELIKAFPEGEERAAINKAFDNLFENLKEDGYFHPAANENSKPAGFKEPSGRNLKPAAQGEQISIFGMEIAELFGDILPTSASL